MEFLFLGLTSDQWADLGLSVLLVAAVGLLGNWLVNIFLNRFARRLARLTRFSLDDELLEVLPRPLHWLVFVIILRIAIDRLNFVPFAWDNTIENIFFLLYIAVGFIIAWRLIVVLFNWYAKEIALRTETSLDEILVPFLRRVALIILAAIVVIMFLDHFEVDVSGLVATLGIGSLAIALAAQAALEDIFSGIVIMIDQPFRIGDRIEIQELDTWGDVVDIGLRSTQIRTRDNRMVIIPNAVIGKSLIVNHAYPDTQYRIENHIGIAYGSDIELARETMVKAVLNVEGVLPDLPVEALFLEFGDSALIFRLRWWLESYEDTRRMFDRVNTAVYKALTEAGIEIPFPQRDVHHKISHTTAEQVKRFRIVAD